MKILNLLKHTVIYFLTMFIVFYGLIFVKDLSKDNFKTEIYDYVLTNNFLSNKSVNFIYDNENESIALLRRYNSFYNPYYNCEVVLNHDKYNKVYGDNDLAKEFIIAHELGHCELYDFMNSEFISLKLSGEDELNNRILSFLSRNKSNTLHVHFEENLADYYATFILLKKYNYSDETYNMIRDFSEKRINKTNAMKEKFKGKVILDFWTHDIGENVLKLLNDIKENEEYYSSLSLDDFKPIAFKLALYNTIRKVQSDPDVVQSIIIELVHYKEINKKDKDFLYELYPNPFIKKYINTQYEEKGNQKITSQKVYVGDL